MEEAVRRPAVSAWGTLWSPGHPADAGGVPEVLTAPQYAATRISAADGAFSWVTLRARWVTLRARWVTLRARWVTFRCIRRRAVASRRLSASEGSGRGGEGGEGGAAPAHAARRASAARVARRARSPAEGDSTTARRRCRPQTEPHRPGRLAGSGGGGGAFAPVHPTFHWLRILGSLPQSPTEH